MKNPIIAAAISIPFPGAGCFYSGYYSIVLLFIWPLYAVWLVATKVASSIDPMLGSAFSLTFVGFQIVECVVSAGMALEANERALEKSAAGPKKIKFYKYEHEEVVGTPVEELE